ncbi:hypothetical protein MINTM019_21060 [Mycobacterium paraintracellulare]|nr:hypothetical protein MINTM019_21060 [Mycobacterium paraintracellulare]BCP10015.1 hypothetical protein MINTM020_21130 [Mycobacterium paraintracellulare]
MRKPEAIIDKPRETLEKEQSVAELLERPLRQAHESAEAKFQGDLLEALVPVPRPGIVDFLIVLHRLCGLDMGRLRAETGHCT